jgi:vitamin B12 transporter
VSARLGITPLINLDFDVALRYSKSRSDLDGYSSVPPYSFSDIRGYYSNADQLYLRSEGNLSLFNNFWDQKLGLSLNDSKRDYSDGYYYNGQSLKFDWQHLLHLHKTNDFTLGLERKDEYAQTDGMDEKHAATTSFYFQDQIKLFDRWFTTLGVRVDDHDRFGTEATYRFTTAYLVKQTGTKIRGSYGSGFRSPSLYELYAPALPLWSFLGGNANLKPEKSTGWDIGVEQTLQIMKTHLSVTWFRNDFKDMIRYMTDSATWNSYYDNVDKAHSQGIELTASLQPLDELAFKATYTYTEAKDDTSGSATYGKHWAYRPKNKLTFDANYSFLKKANLNLGLVYVGTRYSDADNNNKMKDYLLVNLAGSYDITKNLQVFGRVDNLFDRQYEEVAGYGTPGIGAYGGVKVSF